MLNFKDLLKKFLRPCPKVKNSAMILNRKSEMTLILVPKLTGQL